MKSDDDTRPLANPTASDSVMPKEGERVVREDDKDFDRGTDENRRGSSWDAERLDDTDTQTDVRPTIDPDLVDETEDRE